MTQQIPSIPRTHNCLSISVCTICGLVSAPGPVVYNTGKPSEVSCICDLSKCSNLGKRVRIALTS